MNGCMNRVRKSVLKLKTFREKRKWLEKGRGKNRETEAIHNEVREGNFSLLQMLHI